MPDVIRSLKPLFRPEVVRDHLRRFDPETDTRRARDLFAGLADLFARPTGQPVGEENLKPLLFSDVFCGVLGYNMITQSAAGCTLVPEYRTPAGGGIADAVLGRIAPDARSIVAAVEVKGPRDPLDIPHGGRRLSAVEQGFDYAINLGCDWIVVTSMAETRLYFKGADRFTCERFDLARLASSDDAVRHFLFVLGAPRVIPPSGGRSQLYTLLDESRATGEQVTRSFYAEYSRLRGEAFAALTRANPGVDRDRLLAATQKLLDRILFCAFSEDRGLLPPDTIRRAFDHADPFNPRPKWETFLGLFRSVNDGNPLLGIPRYNGGLFAPDPVLDALAVPDDVCGIFRRLADFDFRSLDPADLPADAIRAFPADGMVVDVEILGHIFEQSITDLERIRLEIDGTPSVPAAAAPAPPDPKRAKARRKKEGAFYTPKFITRHIVSHALNPVLAERLDALRARHHAAASGTARRVLADPGAFDAADLNAPQRDALIAFWIAWQEELATIRILDPACGSGAFLIEAFDQLQAAYQAANERLEILRGHAELLDLNREILQKNLYGVDLNDEAVEICRLSLWIKTAQPGKVLTALDHTIRAGNSLIADPAFHPRAFDWHAAFPEVFADGGFDVVVGNPPYIRQEWISPFKPYLETHYRAYSGTADFYLYFIEKGLDLLRPGGRLGFITSGTFARSNSAVEFRRWLPTVGAIESMVNFGDSHPFGPDVWAESPTVTILCKHGKQRGFPYLFIHDAIPESLEEAIMAEAITCDDSLFEDTEWKFQPAEITRLFRNLMETGRPLREVCCGRMYRGILTGLNEAFIVDTPTRDRLVAEDPACEPLLKRVLKGEDLRPWYQDWEGRWLVFTRRGIDIDSYPSVKRYLEGFREMLEPRPDDWNGKSDDWPGRKPGSYKWYELQDSIDYYAEFDKPKIMWPEFGKIPRFSWESSGIVVNNKGYLALPPSVALLGILQSRVSWFLMSQIAVPLGIRAGLWRLQTKGIVVERLRIPAMDASESHAMLSLALEATSVAGERHALHGSVRKRIASDLGGAEGKLNNALTEWWRLDFPSLRTEARKAFKAEIPVRERHDWEHALAAWRTEHERLTARLVAIEEEINDRTNRLFGLSPTDVRTLEDFQKRTKTYYPLGEI